MKHIKKVSVAKAQDSACTDINAIKADPVAGIKACSEELMDKL